VDDVVVFHPLTRTHLRQIVDIQLRRLEARLTDRRLTLEFTDAAKDWLAERGFDPVYGARPLKRAVQSNVETVLARKLIGGEIHEGDHVVIDVAGGALVFKPGNAQQSRKAG
jgi:ATP-dependent Clp protease ATP-binding subunit ClpB